MSYQSTLNLERYHKKKSYDDIIKEFIAEYANPRTGWKLSQNFVIESLDRVGAFKRTYTELGWRLFEKRTIALQMNDDIHLQIYLARCRFALFKLYDQTNIPYDLIEMIINYINHTEYEKYRKFQIYIGQRYQNQKARLSQINDMKRSLSQINR